MHKMPTPIQEPPFLGRSAYREHVYFAYIDHNGNFQADQLRGDGELLPGLIGTKKVPVPCGVPYKALSPREAKRLFTEDGHADRVRNALFDAETITGPDGRSLTGRQLKEYRENFMRGWDLSLRIIYATPGP